MPVIAWIVSALVWTFKNRIGLFILQALAFLGLTYGTTKIVIEPVLDMLTAAVNNMSASGDLGEAIMGWMGVLQFDIACTMIMSAYVTKLGVGAAKTFIKRA